jgi:hypothetical protein
MAVMFDKLHVWLRSPPPVNRILWAVERNYYKKVRKLNVDNNRR